MTILGMVHFMRKQVKLGCVDRPGYSAMPINGASFRSLAGYGGADYGVESAYL